MKDKKQRENARSCRPGRKVLTALLCFVMIASVFSFEVPVLDVNAASDMMISEEIPVAITEEPAEDVAADASAEALGALTGITDEDPVTEDEPEVTGDDRVTEAIGPDADGPIAVSYIDHTVSGSGENTKAAAVTGTCSDYTLITEDTTSWGGDTCYVAGSAAPISDPVNITIDSRITVTGNVNLILCDNCTLTAAYGITVEEGNTLNIYAQSEGENMGKLIVPRESLPASDALYYAGIGGGSDGASCGTVNIHGGDMEINGYNGAGIGGAKGTSGGGGGGTVTIYGGRVNARSASVGAGIGGGGVSLDIGADSVDSGEGSVVTVYGGDVTAEAAGGGAGIGGGGGGIGNGNTVSIYGGKVEASTSSTNAIGSSSRGSSNGALILGTNVKLYGHDESQEDSLIQKVDNDYARKRYMTAIYTEPEPEPEYYNVQFNMQGHGSSVPGQSILSGSRVNRPADPVAEDYDFAGWFTDATCTKEYDFTKPVYTGFTLYAAWTPGLSSVRITAAPAKTIYMEGDVFDPEGMIVTAVYTDGSEKPVTDYTYAPDGALKKTDAAVTVSYTGGNKTCTANQPISVRIKGTDSALFPVPFITESTTVIYMVKGQSFTMQENGWAPATKDDKTFISVSKKGLIKAKKVGNVVLNLVEDGKVKRSIAINISDPVIPKKLKLTTGQEAPGQIELSGCDEGHLKVFWISASPDVATVDQSGYVTPVGRGKSVVTAYINGRAYKCAVTVVEKEPAKERTLHLIVGAKKTMSIKGVKSPVWSSADESIATFSNNKVTAKAVGETVLTATDSDGTEYRVLLTVEDIALSGEGLDTTKSKNKYSLTLKAGDSTQLAFDQVSQPFVFTVTKPEIAFIDENGLVTALKKGKCKFTAKINGKTITVNVVVND